MGCGRILASKMPNLLMTKFLYLCSAGHETQSLQWSTVTSIKCGHCRRKAHMSVHYTAVAHHRAPRFMYFEHPVTKQVLTPGSVTDVCPKGYETKTIDNCVQRDRFYKRMNLQARMEHESYAGDEQRYYEDQRAQANSELRQMMDQGVPVLGDDGLPTGQVVPMSEYEKDLARLSMEVSPADLRREQERIAAENPRIAEKLARSSRLRPITQFLFNREYDPGSRIDSWEFDSRTSREHYEGSRR